MGTDSKEMFEKNLKAFVDRRKNRAVGRILHAYDTGSKSLEFKKLVKSTIMELSKEFLDLCLAFNSNSGLFLNLFSEEVLKEIEKSKGGVKNTSPEKTRKG